MKIVIIGAVAAGTSAATKARRNDNDAQIVIYEKDQYISYSGCGLPYYIGGEVDTIEELVPRDVAYFKEHYNVDIVIKHEVLAIDVKKQELTIKNLDTGEVFKDQYDKLVISTGAVSFIPKIEGVDKKQVFALRNVNDGLAIKTYVEQYSPKKIVIAGTGFIGFELLENLRRDDVDIVIVEMLDKITPNLDKDMADYFESILVERGIKIRKSCKITRILDGEVELNDKETIPADMVILATGVRPETSLAVAAGIELGITGAIKVSDQMETSIEGIYACGDCVETYSSITGKAIYRPLGTTANKTGRIVGEVITGGSIRYRGNLSTSIFKFEELTIASTGLSETEAIDAGFDVIVHHDRKFDKAYYFHGARMKIKAIADRQTGQLLGAQIVGEQGVDKRIDVIATLLTYKAKVEDLFHLDLAYSPPYSTTKDPVHYIGMVLDKKIKSK